jgi:hypothetical protein
MSKAEKLWVNAEKCIAKIAKCRQNKGPALLSEKNESKA